ncbi:hypothetical protein CHH55_14390 [Niallia circulans]|uniref:Uncharacterized protein n=1 Tax=Niallia circulans TaxID=1397 RepID=A0A0J1L0X4_NIACI|nr:hypothetical protein [Niallia circulans]KLV22680.1 hypothetical protein ABW02_21015 [Niallia circulans]MCM2983145.1 hypothetical protein [Niallia circulans]MDR4318306.1 hypothetical protein [Niallia circulans]MED3840458.1 hypothetical protein [Niallia circulans]MED4243207.1 hypothetical protein [Niallia circulans]
MKQYSKLRITEKDENIYNALCDLYKEKGGKVGIGPTEIGIRVGRDSYDASAYCNASLKKLIHFKKIEKIDNGKYIPLATGKEE